MATFVLLKRRPNRRERESLTATDPLILRQWSKLSAHEGCLVWTQTSLIGKHWQQLILPRNYITKVLKLGHDASGHQGPERTFQLEFLRRRCYWPQMEEEITSYCDKCHMTVSGVEKAWHRYSTATSSPAHYNTSGAGIFKMSIHLFKQRHFGLRHTNCKS